MKKGSLEFLVHVVPFYPYDKSLNPAKACIVYYLKIAWKAQKMKWA